MLVFIVNFRLSCLLVHVYSRTHVSLNQLPSPSRPKYSFQPLALWLCMLLFRKHATQYRPALSCRVCLVRGRAVRQYTRLQLAYVAHNGFSWLPSFLLYVLISQQAGGELGMWVASTTHSDPTCRTFILKIIRRAAGCQGLTGSALCRLAIHL